MIVVSHCDYFGASDLCSVQYASVRRNGQLYSVSANQLTIGDIITVKSGDQVPADMRIVSANGFKV